MEKQTPALGADRLDELIGTWKAAMRLCEFDEYKLKSRDLEDFVTAAEAARQAEALADALKRTRYLAADPPSGDGRDDAAIRERVAEVAEDALSAYRVATDGASK